MVGAGDVAGVAVADGLAAGDELHVGPVDAGVVEGGQRGVDAVLVEGPAPLAPLVHARPRGRRRVSGALMLATGFQR